MVLSPVTSSPGCALCTSGCVHVRCPQPLTGINATTQSCKGSHSSPPASSILDPTPPAPSYPSVCQPPSLKLCFSHRQQSPARRRRNPSRKHPHLRHLTRGHLPPSTSISLNKTYLPTTEILARLQITFEPIPRKQSVYRLCHHYHISLVRLQLPATDPHVRWLNYNR